MLLLFLVFISKFLVSHKQLEVLSWIFNSSLLEPQSLRPRVQGQSWAPEQALPPGSGFFCLVVATLHKARGVRGHLLVACLRRGSLKITGLPAALEELWEVP